MGRNMTKARLGQLLFIPFFLLPACVPHQPISGPTGTVPPAVVQSGPIKFKFLSGRISVISRVFEVNPDCSSRGLSTYRILKQPSHGFVATSEIQDFPSYPAANPRSACNTKKVPGMEMTYTPEAGFSGIDTMVVETIASEGRVTTATLEITIE